MTEVTEDSLEHMEVPGKRESLVHKALRVLLETVSLADLVCIWLFCVLGFRITTSQYSSNINPSYY